MTTDAKLLVETYVDRVWNHGDLAAFEGLTSPGFTYAVLGDVVKKCSFESI